MSDGGGRLALSGETERRRLKRRSEQPDIYAVKHLQSLRLDELKAERRRLSAECTQLAWARRLTTARRDLEVARLTGDAAALWGVEAHSQCPNDPTCARPELLGQLLQSVRTLTIAADSAQHDLEATTAELVRRYRFQPRACLPDAARSSLADSAG